MADKTKLDPRPKLMMQAYLSEQLEACKTRDEKIRLIGGVARDMHPDDTAYFVKLFLAAPSTAFPTHKSRKDNTQGMTLENYNKTRAGGWDYVSRMSAEQYHDQVVRKGSRKVFKLHSMNKVWRKKTLVANRLLSDEMLFFAPHMGGTKKLRQWITKVIKKWPVYGGECPYLENGMKSIPDGWIRTATIEVAVFRDFGEIAKPISFYKVFAIYDKITMSCASVWSEYTNKAIKDLPITEVAVQVTYNEEGKRVVHTSFTKASGM